MFGQNDLEITLYFVGVGKDEAELCAPFDSYDSARSYADDSPTDGIGIWAAGAMVDFNTLEKIYVYSEDKQTFVDTTDNKEN